MTEQRTPFQHAVANPTVRRDIAAAVRDGIPVEQLAEEFQIAPSTVRAYAAEWQGAQRKLQVLTDWEREAIIEGCARGARRRWERTYSPEVIRELLGEA
ncbi:helix-turn-helix domain-containing protein [Mycolicibacterium smegmatis]|uniref:helix-turn-helix domain-containing protein n=1 Tax=Mycolicibacterium smegmatis TaxID=1772 RepID=UPI0020A51694|nr:helix-turn-helix domain-containing protein [Mycolicibacterium smegmatis]MCP2622060.1 helix-turn-helix domain-containing protein [Mycolicibacterium smegmatis]